MCAETTQNVNWSVAASSTYLNIRWTSWPINILCKRSRNHWDLAAGHIRIFCQIMLATSRDNKYNQYICVCLSSANTLRYSTNSTALFAVHY